MILKRRVCLLLLCACLPGVSVAAGGKDSLGEHFLTTLGLRRLAGMIAEESVQIEAAVRGRVEIKSVKAEPTSAGRGMESRELEITAEAAAGAAQGRKLRTVFTSAEQELPLAEGITLFDRLQRQRWLETAGEVVILRGEIPERIGEEFADGVLKLPMGTLQRLDAALRRRREHVEWFADGRLNDTVVKGMMAELKVADPLWALVLRMRLFAHGHEELAREWGGGVDAPPAYDAALVMHMLSKQEKLTSLFEPLVARAARQAGTGSGLALGALCASVHCQHGLLCWYQCEFVHPKSGMSWEDWQELAPAMPMCPSYGLACRLSLAQVPRVAENELMLRVLREMGLIEKE
jgi:hypothetical protein